MLTSSIKVLASAKLVLTISNITGAGESGDADERDGGQPGARAGGVPGAGGEGGAAVGGAAALLAPHAPRHHHHHEGHQLHLPSQLKGRTLLLLTIEC